MLVYIAVLTPVLLLFCGLVLDVGQMQVRRLQMQSACDAAAIGAALEIERGTGNYVAMGKGDASLNGFTDGTNGATVNVQSIPTYGDYNGYYDAVQTTISQPVSLTLLRLLGSSLSAVTVQSTALVSPCGYATGAANLVSPVFKATGATMSASCPWYFYRTVQLDSATTFNSMAANVVGPAGSSTWRAAGSPTPRFGVPQAADPLAAIAQPTLGGCQVNNASVTDGSTQTAYPGVYCGTSTVSNHSTINFSPGLYIFTGGLTVSDATLNGTGVTLFFTSGGGAGYGAVSMTNTTLNQSAPTSSSGGGIPGILFMTDRNWTHTNAQDFSFSNCTFRGDGIFYLTGTGLSLTGGSNFNGTNYLALDVDNLVVSNSTLNLSSNYSGISAGNPFLPKGGLVQ